MNHSHVFIRYPGGKAKALTFSFDDGSDQDIWLCNLLRERGMKATFNINMGLLPPCENFDFNSLDEAVFPCKEFQHRLTYNGLKELFVGSGMELATHGYIHADLTLISDDEIAYEILRDRRAIEELMGEPIRGYAYAQGAYNDRVVDALRHSGIVYARTANFTSNFELPTDYMRWNPTCQYHSPDAFDLAERFINEKPGTCIYYPDVRAKLLYIFAHSYEFDFHNNYDTMEKLADKLAGHDDIWYCTNMEYYLYDEAYRRLDYNIEKTIVRNPSAIPVWIYVNGKTVEIKPGETIRI